MTEKTDKSLLDAHCQGDATAFGELVRRYGDSLLGYLIRMNNGKEQAEDFFQETFKRVHEKAHTFRGDQFKPWLFKIATHVTLDGFRRQRRLRFSSLSQKNDCYNNNHKEPLIVTAAPNTIDPAEEATKAEQARQVRNVIALLPTKQRATLVLAYYQQLSYQDIAQVLNCSIGTVKTQMFRALKRLAQKLPDVLGGEK